MLAEPTSSPEVQEQLIQKLAEERFKGWTDAAKREAEAYYSTQLNGFLDEAKKEIGKRDDDIQKLGSLVDAQKRAIQELQDRKEPPAPQPNTSELEVRDKALAEANIDRERLENQLKELKRSSDEEKSRAIKKFTDEKNLLNQQIDSLKKTNDDIGKEMKLTGEQLKRVQAESGRTVKELQNLKVNHDQLLKDAQSTVEQLKTNQSTSIQIQKKMKELEESRALESQHSLQVEQHLSVQLKTVLGQLDALQKSTKAEIFAISENKEQLKNKYETRISELSDIINDMTQGQNKINNQLRKEISLVLKEKQQLEAERDSVKTKLRSHESIQQTLESNILNMTKLITDANEKISSFESLNLHQASVISKLQAEVARKSEELSGVETIYSSRLSAAQKELKSQMDAHIGEWQKEKWTLVETKKNLEEALQEANSIALLSSNTGFQTAESDMHTEVYNIPVESYTGTETQLKEQLAQVLSENPLLDLPANLLPEQIIEIKQILPYKELGIASQLPSEQSAEATDMIWENAQQQVQAAFLANEEARGASTEGDVDYDDNNPEHQKIKKTWGQSLILGQTLEAFWSMVNNDHLVSTLQQRGLAPTAESLNQLLQEGSLYDFSKSEDRDKLLSIVKKLGYVKQNISFDMFEKTLGVSDLVLEGIGKLGSGIVHELDVNSVEDWNTYQNTIKAMAGYVFSSAPSKVAEVEAALKAITEGGAVGSEKEEELINEENEEEEYQKFIESRHQAYTNLTEEQKEDLQAQAESLNISRLQAIAPENQPTLPPAKEVQPPTLKRKSQLVSGPPSFVGKRLETKVQPPRKTVRDAQPPTQQPLFGKRFADVTKREIVQPFVARREYLKSRKLVQQRLKDLNAKRQLRAPRRTLRTT